MNYKYSKWFHPYQPKPEYCKKVAYFSMEFGIHQSFNIYSGGLGFLAGSHMRSGFELQQNMIGVGMLWKYGYYDQARNEDQTLKVEFNEKHFDFLEDTGIEVEIKLHDNPHVKVRTYVLKPEIFGTVPMYFFTSSGCSATASEKEQKMIPFSANVFLNDVATETESITKSTAVSVPVKRFCSSIEIPSFFMVSFISGSTSSQDSYFFLDFGAA